MSDTNFDKITDGCINGNGVFDELMRSIKAHLKEEHDSNRLRGAEYTNAYIASIQGAISQAIQWGLGSETAKYQALLLEAQLEGQRKQNEITQEQLAQTIAQTELIKVQTANAVEEGKLIPLQGDMLEVQIETGGLQNQLITQQTLTEEFNTANAETAALTAKYNLDYMLPIQKTVMEQKLITEQAQTQDSTDRGVIRGVSGAQKDLYRKQIDGYDRDAEQKAARTLTDTHGVIVASDVEEGPYAVTNENITSALEALRFNAGLGRGKQQP